MSKVGLNENKIYYEFHGKDENGAFCLRINKKVDFCQLSITSHDDDQLSYMNLDRKELLLIKELIDKKLNTMNVIVSKTPRTLFPK